MRNDNKGNGKHRKIRYCKTKKTDTNRNEKVIKEEIGEVIENE
jgi:hypothetical protein